MAVTSFPVKSTGSKDQLEKQLFKDVQKLIRYLEARKAANNERDSIVLESYERMIQERCDALSNIARR